MGDVSGPRDITIGRDALGNVLVTGDGNDVRVTLVIVDQRLASSLRPVVDPPEKVVNPYRGLDAFRENDTAWFFGRGDLIRQAWILFQKIQRGPGPRILAVLGASGSGKSSLVRAGLLPELVRQPMSGLETPTILVMRPGPMPIRRLAEVLARLPGAGDEIEAALQKSVDGCNFNGLYQIAASLPNIANLRIIIVIDQFEELFTECTDTAARTAFLQNLAFAAVEPNQLISVILTLRRDFAGAVTTPPAFAHAVRDSRLFVQALDHEGLTQAISRPATAMGYPWPPALVESLVAQAEGRAGALPLLQFALKRLWPEHVAGRLEEAAWSSQLIEDFLVQAADALFQTSGGSSSPERSTAQRIIRRAFLAMTQFGEGTADTRRVAPLREFVSESETADQVRNILAPFTAPEARLIVASELEGEPTYELSHEALISSWGQLRWWLGNVPDRTESERIRADLRLERRLSTAATEWKLGRGGLWRPPELELLSKYAKREGSEFTTDEAAFSDASNRAWQHELDDDRNTAERLRRFVKIVSALAGVLAVAFLAAFYLFYDANLERQRADERLNLAGKLMTSVTERLGSGAGVAPWKAAALFDDLDNITASLSADAGDPEIALDRVHALIAFAQTYSAVSDPDQAKARINKVTVLLTELEHGTHSPALQSMYTAMRSEISGDKKRYDTNPSLANFDRAVDDYKDALSLQGQSEISKLRLLRKIAETYMRAADFQGTDKLGDEYLNRAKHALTEADEQWKNSSQPKDGILEAALLTDLLGDLNSRTKDYSIAVESYSTAISAFTSLLRTASFDDGILLFEGESFRKLGDAQRLMHQPSEAAHSYQSAMTLLQEVLDSSPGQISAVRSANLVNYGVRSLRRENNLAATQMIPRAGEGLDSAFANGLGRFQFGMSRTEVGSLIPDLTDGPLAIEYNAGRVNYSWVPLKRITDLAYFHRSIPCLIQSGYVTFLFSESHLFDISVRFLADPSCPEQREVMTEFAKKYSVPVFSNPLERRFRYDGDAVTVLGMTNSYAVSLDFVGR